MKCSAWFQRALFVHVLRDGRDVVASLESIYREKVLASGVGGAAWPLHDSISRWNKAIATSESHLGEPGHFSLTTSRCCVSQR